MAIKQFIAGQFTPSHDAGLLDIFNPATASVYEQCPEGHAGDVGDAVDAAAGAFAEWSKLKPSVRASWLNALADGIAARFDDFVRCESLDTGKPVHIVRDIEIPRAIENFRFFAAACQQSLDQAFHAEAGLNYTLHQPLGTVGVISPWNLPLYLLTWKIAPALAAGNCVIAKPSEITPMSASLLAEVCISIGLPAGVLNIIHGLGETVGRALVEHPDVQAISFTGSTRVGHAIALECAKTFKKVTLEMGGKNPAIIFADAPPHNLIANIARLGFQNSGQICLCGSRLLVQASCYESFKADFLRHIETLSVGDPKDASVRLGPVMSKAHYDKVLGYIELAKQEGGRILWGGEALRLPGALANGWFIAPTVIEGLPMRSRFCQEEVFGPVLSLHAFDNESDALAMANDSSYGLAASVWTSDIARAQRMAEGLETGIVWINAWMQRDLRTPFGGMKQSGFGREGGLDAIKFFSEVKTVSIGNRHV
ncbi:MAG: aldehyde dehydrogenase [Arenimonas sp.]|nr:aldehyde dehydrogenase [Arenimonas sp.]MBP7917369.1 aldehyde dehydrogenase [Arenimonas sp.]